MQKITTKTIEVEDNQEVYISLQDIHADNLLENDSSKGICMSCSNIVSLLPSNHNLFFTSKLKINNVEALTCETCNHPVAFTENLQKDIENTINEFISNRPSINELLDENQEDSFRWCESVMCACMGASNCSLGLSDYLYTKKDWILWKASNPYRETNFVYEIEGIDNRMTAINTLVNHFNYPDKKAIFNALKHFPTRIGLEYFEGTQDSINKDKQNFLELLQSKGFTVKVRKKYRQESIKLTFVRELED